MGKLYTSKAFLKTVGGRMHTSHPTPLYPPLAISYRKHQKSLAYFIQLAQLILFFLLKRRVKRGGPWPLFPINTRLSAEQAPEKSTSGGQAFIREGQSLKLSTKAAVFIRESLLIGGTKHVDWVARPPTPPGAYPAGLQSFTISTTVRQAKLLQLSMKLQPTTSCVIIIT